MHPHNLPETTRRFEANLVWMSGKPLEPHRPLLLKHTTRVVQARILEIRHRVDIHSLAQVPANQLHLNEIGFVLVESQRALFCDSYGRNRQTGSFILIDPISNDTLAAGMISGPETLAPVGPVTAEDREARIGHRPYLILLPNADASTAEEVERTLFDRGYLVYRTDDLHDGQAAADAGLVALVFGEGASEGRISEANSRVLYLTVGDRTFGDILKTLHQGELSS